MIQNIKIFKLATLLMGISVALGAAVAHALENTLTTKALETFQTGARYQLYHALGLLILSTIKLNKGSLRLVYLMIFGTFFFSGNCYIYAFTQQKIFAHLVPLGGISIIVSWLGLFFTIKKEN